MKQELEKRYSAKFGGEKLTQHELFDKRQDQETVVIKSPKIPMPNDSESLRAKKPR
jgi:hypothetical protein